MKLAFVIVDVGIKLPGWKEPRYEFDEEDAPGMRFDRDTFSLVVGDEGVNWSHVIRWRRLNLELVCDDCGRDFKNEQGRASHKTVCKGRKESA